MDRSLWLLLRLRAWAWLRRRGRALRTLKGAILLVVSSLCFLPALLATLFAPRLFIETQVALLERHGALGMLLFCVLNVLLSTGDRVVYYSPAEVNFLFTGPYRPRQVLLYKIAGGLGAAVFTAAMLAVLFSVHSRSLLASFLGLFLALGMLFLFTLGVSLFASTIGALAFDRRRKAVLVGVVVLGLLALIQTGAQTLRLPPRELLERLENAPAVRIVALPFLPFIRTFTAGRLWPDLAGWSIAALAVDAAMLGIVLTVNAQYYEASAAASARLYDRLRRGRLDRMSTESKTYRRGLPMPPRWGGIGPIVWRQWTGVVRSPWRLIGLSVLYLLPVATMAVVSEPAPNDPIVAIFLISTLGSVSLFAPTVVGFDFRPDLGRIEVLKTLPMPAWRLVLGQVATPAFLLTAAQGIAVALIVVLRRPEPMLVGALVALSVPFNALLVEVENLFFLWYPVRWVAMQTTDFQTMGHQILLLLARLAWVGLVAAAATAVGAAGFFVFGESWSAAVAAAWLVIFGFDVVLLPLLAHAFVQFDVARERFE